MSRAPRLTVGVACYNAASTVEAAIRSALGQDLDELEVIAIDDASSDATPAILRRLAAEDDRLRVIESRRNCGAAAVYNAVLDAARGAYLMIVDADDRALPARGRETVAALEAFGTPALCFCDRYIGEMGREVVRGLTRDVAPPADFETYMLDAVCLHHDPALYRAEAAQGARGRFAPLRTHGLGGSSAGSGVMTAPAALLRRLRFDARLRRFADTELNLRAAQARIAAIGVARPLAVQTVSDTPEKSLARRRVYTSMILARHEAAYRRRGVVYPGHHLGGSTLAAPSRVGRKPRATVGVLAYNCEDTLPRAIESAQAQTIDDLEILILDDASTDATAEIAHSYDDRRIRVLGSPWNIGAGANRARLAAAARGAFLAFFDDDDAAHPGRVAAQIADLEALGGPAISIASAFRHHGVRLAEAHRSLGPFAAPLAPAEAERLVWRTILQHSEGKAFLPRTGVPEARYALGASLMCGRTEDFRRVPFDPEMRRMQDLEFLARFTAAGGMLAPTDRPLIDVFVTRGAEKRWSRVIEYCSRLLAKHDGALERLFALSTAEILRRNRERLPAIRAWEGMRAAFGY